MRKLRSANHHSSDVDDTLNELDVPLSPACKRRRRTAATRTAPSKNRAADDLSDIEDDPDFAEDGSEYAEQWSDSEDDASDEDTSAEDSEPAADEPIAVAAAAAGADLSRPLERAHLQRLQKQRKEESLASKTWQAYAAYIRIFERWYAADGYNNGQGGRAMGTQVKAKKAPLGTMSDGQATNLLTRFLEWYVNGRPGDPLKGGQQVAAGQLSRSVAIKVHSALQYHLSEMRAAEGRSGFELAKADPYSALYHTYCNRKRNRAMAAEEEENSYRAACIHMSFGKDAFVRGAHQLLASSEAQDAKTLSMYLTQVQTVARGDDLRGRKLKDLGTSTLTCVGPSTAEALTVLQPPTTGKGLKTRPAYKGMLRSKVPSLCGVGALFRWLVLRFTVLAEAIPMPGTRRFKKFFLWPGREADKMMSYTRHADLMRALFAQLGVDTTKLTHELRIFAAQLLYEMGVPLEVIQRMGHWLLDAFGTAYIVPGFTAEALLALAYWPGAAQKDFSAFWAERFHVAVPEDLVQLLVPGLAGFEQKNVQAAAAGKPSKSVTHLASLLRKGAVIVVQDALELADSFPTNPVHHMLQQHSSFQELLRDYKQFKALGGFSSQKPLSVKEMITQQTTQLQEFIVKLFRSSLGLAAPPLCQPVQLDWAAYDRQVQQSQQQQQQARAVQPQEPSADEVLGSLEQIAAGKAQPVQQFVQQVQQQDDVLVPDEVDPYASDGEDSDSGPTASDSEGPPSDSEDTQPRRTSRAAAATTGPAGSVRSRRAAAAAAADAAPRRRKAAATAVTPRTNKAAAAAAAAAAVRAAAKQHRGHRVAAAAADEGAVLQDSPAAAAGAAAADRAGAAGGGAAHTADSPEPEITYMVQEPVDAAAGVHADALMLTTPSGKQYTAVQLHSRSDATMTPGGTHTAAFFTAQHLADRREQMQLQVRQQESGSSHPPLLQQLLGVAQQQQQTMELLVSRLKGTEQPPAAADTPADELQEIRQALQATQQQVRELQQALQQQQSAAQLDTRSVRYTSRMGGGVDPIAAVSMPYISSRPELQSVLGAANSNSMLPHSSDSGNMAGAILAALDMREERLVQAVAAALQGTSASHHAAMAAGAAAGSGVALVGAVATVNAAAAAVAVAADAAGSKPKEKYFPDLSSHASLAELAEWYYVQLYKNTGKTPQQLEVEGKKDGQQWRGGRRHRIQRWVEYEQLLRVIERQRSDMQEQDRINARNPQSVATVDAVSAAREVDRQRVRLGLSVCEYRQYIVLETSSKGYKKGMAKQQQLLAAAGGEAAAEAAGAAAAAAAVRVAAAAEAAAAAAAAATAAVAAEEAAAAAADTQAGDAASPPVQQQGQHRQTSAGGQQRGRGGRGRGRGH